MLQASMLLGFQRLKSVVITLGLKAYLEDPFTPLLQCCWRHSVACAMIAERVAKWSGFDKDFAYSAGIIHDIGRIALAAARPQLYGSVVKGGADQPQDLLQKERELFRVDHCQAGYLLANAWNLPDAFLDVISAHHEAATNAQGAVSILRPSCALADALGFGIVRYRAPRSHADLLAEFPEPARSRFPADAEDLGSEIANEIKVIESV